MTRLLFFLGVVGGFLLVACCPPAPEKPLELGGYAFESFGGDIFIWPPEWPSGEFVDGHLEAFDDVVIVHYTTEMGSFEVTFDVVEH